MPSVLLAPLIAGGLLALAWLVLLGQGRWQQRLVGAVVRGGLPATDGGALDILYFTAPTCTICHVAQRPALQRLSDAVRDVRIREIDVALDPRTARTYRVMSLPTTVVLDAEGRTAAVNVGFVSETTLQEQVQAARQLVRAGALA